MKHHRPFFLGLISLFLLAGCDQSSLGLFARTPGENPPDVVEEGGSSSGGSSSGGTTEGTVLINRWTQPLPTIRPVDILFVTDTSGSMDSERVAVANALSDFLGTFEARGIDDYCIGILRGIAGDETGDLYSKNFVDDNKCLCSGSLTSAQIQTKFLESFGDNSMPDQDEGAVCTLESGNDCTDDNPNTRCTCTDGGEVGLYSFHKSFIGSLPKGTTDEQTTYENNRDLGCFRNNAAIASIFVTDENDLSTSRFEPEGECESARQTLIDMGVSSFDPAGPASTYDAECMEMGGRFDFYSDVNGNLTRTPDLILGDMLVSQGLSPFVSAVVGYVNSETFIPNGENEYPYGYSELVEDSGGDFVDITLSSDQAAFNQAFTELGTNLSQQTTLITVFDLSSPACSGTLEVTVDGDDVMSYVKVLDSRRFTIAASAAGDVGSLIEARYEVCN